MAPLILKGGKMLFKVKNQLEYKGKTYRSGDVVDIPAKDVAKFRELLNHPMKKKVERAVKKGEER